MFIFSYRYEGVIFVHLNHDTGSFSHLVVPTPKRETFPVLGVGDLHVTSFEAIHSVFPVEVLKGNIKPSRYKPRKITGGG